MAKPKSKPKSKPNAKASKQASTPFETTELRDNLAAFLSQKIGDIVTKKEAPLGSHDYGVYAFFDYDGEPIYVGQTCESLGARIGRHLTNQRTDAVAMNVLDPFEVHDIQVWPILEYQNLKKHTEDAKAFLNWLERDIFNHLISQSHFQAILNEKDPDEVPNKGYKRPQSIRGCIVSKEVEDLRGHPDTRIARRAGTLSLLAKVISERQVKPGLRRALLTQAKRVTWLASRRLGELAEQPTPLESSDE